MSIPAEKLGKMGYNDIVSCGGVISEETSMALLDRIRRQEDLSSEIHGTTWMHLIGLSGMYADQVFSAVRTYGAKISDSTAKDERGRTPLHMTALTSAMQRTDFLLDRFFIKPDEKDDEGLTPLFVMARHVRRDLLLFRSRVFAEKFLYMGASPLCHDGQTLRDCISPRLSDENKRSWEQLFVKSEKLALELSAKDESLSSGKRSSRTV